jgi:hypothetical protein
MGIEPTKFGEKARAPLIFGVWRYRCYSFFAASSLFFFVKGSWFCIQDRVGVNIYESKFRGRRIRKGTITKIKAINRNTREMSAMWQHSFLERWTKRRTLRNNTTLPLQKLCVPILNLVNLKNSIFYFFIFDKHFPNLSRRRGFEDLQ